MTCIVLHVSQEWFVRYKSAGRLVEYKECEVSCHYPKMRKLSCSNADPIFFDRLNETAINLDEKYFDESIRKRTRGFLSFDYASTARPGPFSISVSHAYVAAHHGCYE